MTIPCNIHRLVPTLNCIFLSDNDLNCKLIQLLCWRAGPDLPKNAIIYQGWVTLDVYAAQYTESFY